MIKVTSIHTKQALNEVLQVLIVNFLHDKKTRIKCDDKDITDNIQVRENLRLKHENKYHDKK